MCDDETCIGGAVIAAEHEERKERALHLAEHSTAYLGKPAWPPSGHIVVASRGQTEQEEWREADQRQRYRDAGGVL